MADRVAIIGSREWPEPERVRAYVRGLPVGTVVVTGGWWSLGLRHVEATRGVDREAAEAAAEYGHVTVLVCGSPQEGKRAGLQRNPVIVDCADRVVAFHDGQSRGTMHTVRYAERVGKPVEIIRPGGEDAWGLKHDRVHRDRGKGRAARTVRGKRGDEW